MNKSEAEKLARAYLSEHIEFELPEQSDIPEIYNFDASKYLLFSFRLFGHHSVGSSEYISVSKETGEVGYIGRRGE